VATRRDGRPQLSPVSAGVDPGGRIVVPTYPQRAKTSNTRRDPEVSIGVLSDHFDGPWVQVYGTAEVLDMPEAAEPFVDYFRSIAGEHPDWDEYKQAMADQDKSLIQSLMPFRAARSGLKMGSWLPADAVAPWSFEAVI